MPAPATLFFYQVKNDFQREAEHAAKWADFHRLLQCGVDEYYRHLQPSNRAIDERKWYDKYIDDIVESRKNNLRSP